MSGITVIGILSLILVILSLSELIMCGIDRLHDIALERKIRRSYMKPHTRWYVG